MNERVFEIMEEMLPVGGKHLIEDMILPFAVKIEELERKNSQLRESARRVVSISREGRYSAVNLHEVVHALDEMDRLCIA